jgi:hypothetical protein
MKPHNNYKSFSLIFFLIHLIIYTGCTTKEDQLISMGEANKNIITAIFTKDSLCHTTHQLTLPVFSDVRTDNVSLCVQSILATNCDSWATSSELPVTCNLLVLTR